MTGIRANQLKRARERADRRLTAHSKPRRHRWRLPLILAAVAALLVWAFDLDPAHAVSVIAGAAVLGLCNDFADGLRTQRLQPEKLRGHEQGATEQQFVAYSLTSGSRPVGERAYRHFLKLARGRIKLLGIGIGGPESAGNRVHAGTLLHSFLTDQGRGARMTHAELRKCLDQLDALIPDVKPSSNRPVATESRPQA
ncbi:hypothetical protein [Arthrobacter sp. H14]|uniref:hypothetical protein n=1 Tax=Arthrobacter sp. H14 TaxID=1312959 RepID=UPI0004791C00|nr:hypothetical protein [Arthrobacter sp. H14]